MTHHLTPYRSHPPAAGPSGPRSRFNRFLDLTPLLQAVEMLAGLIGIQMRGFDMPELERLCRWKTKADKQLETAKLHNFKVGMKWNMLRRATWRGKVLEDLGGEAALEKWDKRADASYWRARQPAKPAPYKRPDLEMLRNGEFTPAKPRSGPRTDSTGVFRLAPIPGRKRTDDEGFSLYDWEREEQAEARRLRADLRAGATSAFDKTDVIDPATIKGFWFKDEAQNTINIMSPIPLLPNELRGVGIDEIEGPTLSPSPHLWGEVPEAITDRAAGRGDGGAFSPTNPSYGSQTIEPPIDSRVFCKTLDPLPPINGEKGGIEAITNTEKSGKKDKTNNHVTRPVDDNESDNPKPPP